MSMSESVTYEWKIKEVCPETELVSTLVLEPVGERPKFIAGQYLTVLLPGMEPAEGKSYSISSAPHEDLLTLTVKRMGSFSEALLALSAGESLTTSTPYGFFYPEEDDLGELVFLAGGIGITPIWSILKDLENNKDSRPRYLFYSNQTEREVVFKKEITELSQRGDGSLLCSQFITREQPSSDECVGRRMCGEDVLRDLIMRETATFFVCGSSQFTRGMWQELKNGGVRPEQIYTEGFF